jgi:hypothetical protein
MARALNLDAAQALGAQTILCRDERVRGTLHRLPLTLLALSEHCRISREA